VYNLLKFQVLAAAKALFNLNASVRQCISLSDEKDVHLMGKHPVHPLRVNG
jgi:hypothetical protein